MIQFVVVVGVLVLMVINTVIIRTIDFADFLDNRIHPPTNGTPTADPSSLLNVSSRAVAANGMIPIDWLIPGTSTLVRVRRNKRKTVADADERMTSLQSYMQVTIQWVLIVLEKSKKRGGFTTTGNNIHHDRNEPFHHQTGWHQEKQ